MSEKESKARRQFVDNLIKSVDASEDPERELLRHLILRTEQRDPELAKIIRYCAIPRRFDAEIIGVLCEAPDESEANQRWLTSIVSFSFVTRRFDGGYAYDDTTRQLLLEDWRTAERRTEFDELNQRLVTFYQSQHVDAQRAENDLKRVADVVRKASMARRAQLASLVEQHVVAPLLEALYHATLRSAQDGYSLFTSYCEAHEAQGRLAVCESLLNAERSYLEDLPPDSGQEPLLKWMRYWEGRLKQALAKPQEAEGLLYALLPEIEEDTRLRLWALTNYATVLADQGKLPQARDESEKVLALAEMTREDSYNLPVWYSIAADLHSRLGELGDAVDKYRKAIQSAQEQNNLRSGIFSRLSLSEALRQNGEWYKALDAAFESLHLVCAKTVQGDETLYQAVATQFLRLLAPRDQRLFDTMYREAQNLLGDLGDSLPTLWFRYAYSNTLQESGQLKRAENALASLKKDALSFAETAFGTSLLMLEAFLHEKQGRLDEACELHTQILERSSGNLLTMWDHAATLSNRGMINVQLARWRDADADLQQALKEWQTLGQEKLAAYVRVQLARAARRQGRHTEALATLEEVNGILVDTNIDYIGDYNRAWGEAYRDLGRWTEAQDHYRSAVTLGRAVGSLGQAAQDLNDLANVAASQGLWEEADGHAANANELWRQLAAMDNYQPSSAVRQADKDNALGIRYLLEPGENVRESIARARDLFHSASVRVPENFWYHLNLSYAHAELAEWEEAASAVERALESAPEWIPFHTLYERLADYRLRHGESLVETGQYEAARQWYLDSRSRLEGQAPLEVLTSINLRLGDILLKLERRDEAQAEYNDGLIQGTLHGNSLIQATFHTRLGCVVASQGDSSSVLEHFQRSLQLGMDAGWPRNTWDLATSCSPLVSSILQYRTLSEALQVLTYDRANGGAHMQKFKPQLTASLPDGWVAKESTQLLSLDGQANIIASSEPLDPNIDTLRYAEMQGELLTRDFRNYREITFDSVQVFGRRQGYFRHFEWEPEDSAPIAHLQVYYAENGRGYTATATTLSSEFERLKLQLRLLLDGLNLES